MNHAFVNGDIAPADKASLPIADRAVRFGDGVFETLRLYRGVPYLWEYHIERLQQGLEALHIPAPLWPLQESCRALLRQNKAEQGTLRIAVSRGMGSEGYTPTGTQSSLIIETLPPAATSAPQSVWLSSFRRISPSMLPTQMKLTQGVASTLALLEAKRNKADNALMLSIEGHVSECANANIFWQKGGKIYTSPLTTGCVAGTTRRRLMEMAPISESKVNYAELLQADCIAISNARLGLHPVIQIASAEGMIRKPEGLTQLAELLEADCARYANTHAGQWR